MRYFPGTLTAEETRQFHQRILQEFAEFGYGFYAAEEKGSGRFMGFILSECANVAPYEAFAPYIVNVRAARRAGRLCLRIGNYNFQYVHYIGFHQVNMDVAFCPCIEIGWRLDKRFWNRGYATEGEAACLEHGFRQLGFARVYSFTAIQNKASQRVMQKIGLEFERYFDHPNLPVGDPLRPHVCYHREKETT